MKVSNIAPFGVRMPPDLKKRLEISAKKNSRSLNAEVVFWLQKAMDEHEEQSDTVKRLPIKMIDGFGGWYEHQKPDESGAELIEKMKAIIGELENKIIKK